MSSTGVPYSGTSALYHTLTSRMLLPGVRYGGPREGPPICLHTPYAQSGTHDTACVSTYASPKPSPVVT
eukprot:1563960-Rhodomonas_salina.1